MLEVLGGTLIGLVVFAAFVGLVLAWPPRRWWMSDEAAWREVIRRSAAGESEYALPAWLMEKSHRHGVRTRERTGRDVE